jgi:large subunit ribosomal protein L28
MANICEITGKRKLKGHRVSHANNKKIHFQQPNIQTRWLFVPELGVNFKLHVSTRGLRTIDKFGGLTRYVIKQRKDRLPPKLLKLRKTLIEKGVN